MKIKVIDDNPKLKMHIDDTIIREVVCVESGTKEDWGKQEGVVSKKNHLYIYTNFYTDEDGVDHPGIKMGDGKAYIVDLPFVSGASELSTQEFKQHLNDKIIHITQEERETWNNKVALANKGETLIFSYSN